MVVGWIVAALGGAASFAAILKIGPERKDIIARADKTGVDSAQVLATSALSLLQPSLDQIAFLRTELASARDEILALRQEIASLRTGMSAL
jgi:hypothetical protein